MNRFFIISALTLCPLLMRGQSINFTNGAVTYSFPASDAGEMVFTGETVTVAERNFKLSEWSQMKVSDSTIESNTVNITYNGDSADVIVAGNIAKYIDINIAEAAVTVTQSDQVSENTCGEITYILAGNSSNGSFLMNGSYKSTIELRGLTLTNPIGASIDIQNGKRIALSAKSGSKNFLTDGSGSQKGAVVCKGHLELKGKGELTIKGNQSHAIYAKEYVEVKNLTLNINGAVKDGINCAQYFLMESGSISISGTGDDGIQVSYKDETNREPEDTGRLTITGGSLSVTISADAAKCIKADSDIIITDGNINLTSNSNGIWDSSKSKTKASTCIGADGNVNISGGTIDLQATGSGGKGISCDGVFTGDGGKIKIATSGGMFVYSNGNLSHNYTSSADRINSDYKSSSKGIKADSGVIINNGDYNITTSTNNAEGIESKKSLEINGGNIFVKAYDDGINSANDFKINGGDLTVISIVGDGLDSNGNLTINGGIIRTMGSGGMEMGLDAATESGCAVYINGGTLMAFGGRNTYPTNSNSTQAYVKATGAIKADTEISVKSGTETLVSFTVPSEYNTSTSNAMYGPGNGPGGGGWQPGGSSGSGSLMISSPLIKSGQSYTIQNGTSSTTATAVLKN